MAHLYSVSLCGIFASYGFWQTQLVHKNGTRCGWEAKKQTAVHKTGLSCGWQRGSLDKEATGTRSFAVEPNS